MRAWLHLVAAALTATALGASAVHGARLRHHFAEHHEVVAPVTHGLTHDLGHGFGPRRFGGTFARSGLGGRFDVPGDCSVFRRSPCNANPCSVFAHEPCLPETPYPYGETLQLTITSPAADAKPAASASEASPDTNSALTDTKPPTTDTAHRIDTIHDMFDALRGCWVPPPEDEARAGMQMTVRLSFKRNGEMFGAPRVTYVSHDAPQEARNTYHDAITAALDRCTPLHFTAGLGGAIAGRPIAVRFVDNRKVN
jgi:hypothetical protein